SDMMVNRSQARDRAEQVTRIMLNVDFEKAKFSLPALCFTLVEGVTREQQETARTQIDTLSANQGIDPGSKTTILGVYLIREVGADVLEQAVNTLGTKITTVAGAEPGGTA